MFWTITIIVVVAFVAVIGWFGRARGTATSKSGADLTESARQAKWKSQGKTGYF